jgi:hypothetical protein
MADDQTTIITCVEAGALEAQVILLARTLRRFGGRYAGTPIVAVKPRRGPGLAAATLAAFAELDVRYVDRVLNDRHAWWSHANKPAALLWADREVSTPWVTWLDSDMLFLREPDPFAPPAGFDFIARAGEACDVASNGEDERAPFWRTLCAQQGIDFADFPMIASFPEGRPIKAYWQAGAFTFRRGSGLAPTYTRVMADLLDGDVGSSVAGVYHTDQVSLAIAVQRAGVAAAEYSPLMNLNLNAKDPDTFGMFPLDRVKIVHYHGSFWRDGIDWARRQLAGMTPEQHAAIEDLVPFSPGGRVLRLRRYLYNRARGKAARAYEARVRMI